MKQLTKLEVEYIAADQNRTNIAFYENPMGMHMIALPKFPGDAKMHFYLSEDAAGEPEKKTIALETFLKLKQPDLGSLTPSERKSADFLLNGAELAFELDGISIGDVGIAPEKKQKSAPSIEIIDITETLLLNFPPLTMEMLDSPSSGLWSHNGERVFEIEITGLTPEEADAWKPELFYEKAGGVEFFFEYDAEGRECFPYSKKIVPKLMHDPLPLQIRVNPNAKKKYQVVEEGNTEQEQNAAFLCQIDTDYIGERLSGIAPDQPHCSVQMRFRLSKQFPAAPGGEPATEAYEFVFHIFFFNTECSGAACIDLDSRVAIDFGTSSTCAAVDSGAVSMIEMSPDSYADLSQSARARIYENPTNLMIYDWDTLYDVWVKRRDNKSPVMIRRGKEEYREYTNHSFDFGYNVKEQLKKRSDKKNLDAVITDLKMLPHREDKRDPITFIPFEIGSQHEIDLICGEEQDNHSFDPISYYAYLLGKAINHPNDGSNKLYTKYMLTYPVKFSKAQRDRLEKSIRKGLYCALPGSVCRTTDSAGKPLISVMMKNAEPAACLGACCDQELCINDEGKPQLFGVFDFGGGTADFSYGMYREADEILEGGEAALELFGDDGDASFGGELLIKRITYWILTQKINRDVVTDNEIYFQRPKDEPMPDGYSNLLKNNAIARANMRFIGEKISRPYFEGATLEAEEGPEDIPRDELKKDLTLTFRFGVENSLLKESSSGNVVLEVEFAELHKWLSEQIKHICTLFCEGMWRSFSQPFAQEKMTQYGLDVSDVGVLIANNKETSNISILMSGNSSRHPLVRQHLSEIFGADNVFLVGESRQSSGSHYEITPKTAVAFGLLKLDTIITIMPEKPSGVEELFQYYVARTKRTGKETLLHKNAAAGEWVFAGGFREGRLTLYFSTVDDLTNDERWKAVSLELPPESTGELCYIRSKGRDTIEFTAVPRGTKLEDITSECTVYSKQLSE